MNSKNLVFSHYADWQSVPDNILKSMLSEAKELGVENLVFVDQWITRILRNPEDMGFFRLALKNFDFTDMHAPYGECYDLACADNGRREDMIRDHIRAMGYASDFGCRTYTIHIGAYDSVFFHKSNSEIRPLALEALEKLIPHAEKYGVVIAVENAFERSNTPDEVMYYVDYVKHPNVGCCFDSGHALVMDTYPDKGAYSDYMTDMVWSGKVENYTNAFEKMASAMVTCHLHDNDGFSDQHLPPESGIEKWSMLAEKILTSAPRLISVQSEATVFKNDFALADVVKRYRKIFPELA
jgi:sugar phosphate isomerase/epimerase